MLVTNGGGGEKGFTPLLATRANRTLYVYMQIWLVLFVCILWALQSKERITDHIAPMIHLNELFYRDNTLMKQVGMNESC